MSDPEMIEILTEMKRLLYPYFKAYSHKLTNTILEKEFVKFCLDFGIFPSIVKKGILIKIFNILSYDHVI